MEIKCCFPSVVWQVYDWYLEPNAGYYFMQRACEPLHVQLNLDDSMVAVVNRSYTSQPGLTVTADVMDMNGKSLYHQTSKLNSDTSSAKEIFSLASALSKTEGVVFVVLHVADAKQKTISGNVYWFQSKHDYTALSQMTSANVRVKLMGYSKERSEYKYNLQFTNSSEQLAFFINPQLALNEDEIMPAFWSNNYFSLLPGESITVTVSCPMAKLNGKQPTLITSGWNVAKQELVMTGK